MTLSAAGQARSFGGRMSRGTISLTLAIVILLLGAVASRSSTGAPRERAARRRLTPHAN